MAQLIYVALFNSKPAKADRERKQYINSIVFNESISLQSGVENIWNEKDNLTDA